MSLHTVKLPEAEIKFDIESFETKCIDLYVKGVSNNNCQCAKALVKKIYNVEQQHEYIAKLKELNSEESLMGILTRNIKILSQALTEDLSIRLYECENALTYTVELSIDVSPFADVWLAVFNDKEEASDYYIQVVKWNIP